ncbi:MAG: acyl-CoA dehydrogenase family protein, partial [Acidimicrobiales bacterium]
HVARWGMLLARSDPEQPKHRGLSCFVVDMTGPGIEVRPLRQMTGDAEFNEVFLSDARVPDSHRLGDVGGGWSVALTTLMHERVAIGGAVPPRGTGPIADALELWQQRGGGDAVTRDRLVRLWIRAETCRLTNARAAQARRRGAPGPEGSTGKLVQAELARDVYELCIDLLGAEGMLCSPYEMRRPDELGFPRADVAKMLLRSRAASIEGGTSEIMRNILAERVLGLPGDPRVDKGVPWSSVPRS